MQSVRQPARTQPRCRGGFTLIELLIVIVIIGILAALLLPVVSSAMRTAREATVVVEMSNFDKALVEFKNQYAVEVPSFIVLYEQGDDGTGTLDPGWGVDTGNDISAVVADDSYRRASRAFIRQMWPDFDFSYSASPTPGIIDFNDNGVPGEVIVLNGSECLVFFLGGVVRRGGTPFSVGPPISDTMKDDALIGFAANPLNPFDATSTGNRVGPFFGDFLVDRFTDVDNDGMPEYRDGLSGQQRPYVYLSSYGGAGYRPFGLDYDASTNTNPSTLDDEIDPALGLADAYRKDDEVPATTGPYLNLQSYQLISPGFDFEYGAGGEYNGTGVDSSRPAERDNITNFKKGRLN